MREIQLTQDQIAKVSDEDYENLSKYKWAAYRIAGKGRNGTVYLYGFKAGYKLNGKKYWMHNVLMEPSEGQEVDHIDGDPLNNQRDNLRIVQHGDNCKNRGKRSNGGTSKYLGVCKKASKNKFVASIRFNDKSLHIGYFDNEEDAARAYDAKAKEVFGEFARLNFKGD